MTRDQERITEPAEAGEAPYRRAEETIARAIQWILPFAPDDRFFLWVHLYDPHQPLAPPDGHRESVTPDDEATQRERIRFLRDEQHISSGLGHDGRRLFRKGDRGMLDLTFVEYFNQTVNAVGFNDIAMGVVKSAVFGVLVALSGCMRGMQSGRSASAVGVAATSAVVTAIVFIIVTDAIFAVVTNILGV